LRVGILNVTAFAILWEVYVVGAKVLRRLNVCKPILVIHEISHGARYGGHHLSCIDRKFLRCLRVARTFLFESAGEERKPIMNWVYWLSGIAALAIFVYLVVALFKPQLFS